MRKIKMFGKYEFDEKNSVVVDSESKEIVPCIGNLWRLVSDAGKVEKIS